MCLSEQKKSNPLNRVISYTYPKLHTGKCWYINFMAFDPAENAMRRKRIKINHIEKISDRRRYADALMKRLMNQLDNGWNPWIESENAKAYHTFADVILHYKKFLDKMFHDGVYREDTYLSYLSYIRIIENFNAEQKIPITYIYQFDSIFIQKVLEYAYIDRNNSAQTRNNYLIFLKVFSSWLVQNQYLKTKPTEGIKPLGKNLRKKKSRDVIKIQDLVRLRDYLMANNKHYLLACYLLHYCFIRPKEMSKLRISAFSLSKQTVFIEGEISKNRNDATITLPKKIIELMLDLNIFNNPGDYFLFSDNFMPGKIMKSEKQFRDYWNRYVRRDLKFPKTYKLYSLKDTGITNMLRSYDRLSVRDQARHSSLMITDIYTPHDIENANDLIKNLDGEF